MAKEKRKTKKWQRKIQPRAGPAHPPPLLTPSPPPAALYHGSRSASHPVILQELQHSPSGPPLQYPPDRRRPRVLPTSPCRPSSTTS